MLIPIDTPNRPSTIVRHGYEKPAGYTGKGTVGTGTGLISPTRIGPATHCARTCQKRLDRLQVHDVQTRPTYLSVAFAHQRPPTESQFYHPPTQQLSIARYVKQGQETRYDAAVNLN